MELHLVLLLCLTAPEMAANREDLTVTTDTGIVRGERLDVNGVGIHRFFGIPFAKPPVNELRFKPPEPIQHWEGVLNATKPPNSCMQSLYNSFPGFPGSAVWLPNTNLSEDCLYLNVWTPANAKSNSKLAVLSWIFGGGFYSGTSTLEVYDPRSLVSMFNVVVVSFNHRLGPFGFLYLGTKEAPGNMGLKDQNMAMEWIHRNIDKFGGDPDRITLIGESSGASSIHIHMLAGAMWPYFNSVILQSGSVESSWSYHRTNVALDKAIKLAEAVGCPNDRTQIDEIIRCLRSKPADQLTDGQSIVAENYIFETFIPTMDQMGYLADEPLNLIQARRFKKVNILAGINANEGSYFLLYAFLNDLFNLTNVFPMNREKLETSVEFLYPQFKDKYRAAEKAVLLFEYEYMSNRSSEMPFHLILSEMTADTYFVCPVLRLLRDHFTTETSTFMYQFAHRSSSNPWPEWMGVMHADEIEYVFGLPFWKNSSFTDEERELSGKIMRFWTNFAKTGDPNCGEHDTNAQPEWPRYTNEKKEYLILKNGGFRTGASSHQRQCAIWNDLLPKIRSATDPSYGYPTSESIKTCSAARFKAFHENLIIFVLFICTWNFFV